MQTEKELSQTYRVDSVARMKTKILWPVIQANLDRLERDQAWLARQLGVHTNVVTNWKQRGGAPASRARELQQIFDTPVDQLLGNGPDDSLKRVPKRHLSNEAQALILCVTRLDGFGDQARKLFANQLSTMEIAAEGWGVQYMDRGQMTEEIDDLLTALAEATGTHDAATHRQKRSSSY